MRGLFGVGIVLLIVGLAILAWPVISYTDRETAVDIGPIEVQTERESSSLLPPLWESRRQRPASHSSSSVVARRSDAQAAAHSGLRHSAGG